MPPKSVARKSKRRGVPGKEKEQINNSVNVIGDGGSGTVELSTGDKLAITQTHREDLANSNHTDENGADLTSSGRVSRKRKLQLNAVQNDLDVSLGSPKLSKRSKKYRLDPGNYLPKVVGHRVLSCGEGEQLGHPGRTSTRKPRAVDGLPQGVPILQVAAGGVHSIILLGDASVLSCGINEKGTVPVEDVEIEGSTDKFSRIVFPCNVTKEGKIVMVAAGASFSAALTESGSVIAWGNIRDASGCIESHKILVEMEKHPVVIVHSKYHKIIKIVAGENHLVMLSWLGELLTFGDGSMGQLGRSARLSSIRSNRMVDDSGDALLVSVKEKSKNKLVVFDDVMAGGFWTAARAHDDRIFVFGLNNFGQLGVQLPEMNDESAETGGIQPELRIMRPILSPAFQSLKIRELAGVHHLIALDDNGSIYGIGKNTDNALGLGTWTGKGNDENWKYSKLQSINLSSKVIGISAKLGCSIAWTKEGVAYAWGYDTSGQLGLGIKEDEDDKCVPTPKQIQSAHLEGHRILSCSISDNHALFLAEKI